MITMVGHGIKIPVCNCRFSFLLPDQRNWDEKQAGADFAGNAHVGLPNLPFPGFIHAWSRGFHFIKKREAFAGDMVADRDIIGVGLKAQDLKNKPRLVL